MIAIGNATTTAAPYLASASPWYLTGVSNDLTRRIAAGDLYGRLGVLLGPGTYGGSGAKADYRSHLSDYGAWGLDNGCFTNRGEFDARSWLSQLANIVDTVDGAHESCLFAVAPDVFHPENGGSMAATIERSLPILPKIRRRGVPAALVLQDDAHTMLDRIPWDEFDVAFIGGRDDFKLGFPARFEGRREPVYDRQSETTLAWARLIAECQLRGKSIHVGRVNSRIRLAFARDIYAGSADGTYLRFRGGERGISDLTSWLKGAE